MSRRTGFSSVATGLARIEDAAAGVRRMGERAWRRHSKAHAAAAAYGFAATAAKLTWFLRTTLNLSDQPSSLSSLRASREAVARRDGARRPQVSQRSGPSPGEARKDIIEAVAREAVVEGAARDVLDLDEDVAG